MKLFIQIATILAISLLVGFSQAHASDSYCMEKVRKCQDPPKCRHWKIEEQPKNTPECREFRRKLREALGMPPDYWDQLFYKPKEKDLWKEFRIPNTAQENPYPLKRRQGIPSLPVDEPKDTKSTKPTETPNLK